MSLKCSEKLFQYQSLVNGSLPRLSVLSDSSVLGEVMRYSVLNGGKRIRPVLMFATAEYLGAAIEPLVQAACAVEIIHSASLILDDLPCMDDAALRRGQPTSHRQFGEANTVLAAMVMVYESFGLIVNTATDQQLPLSMIREVMETVLEHTCVRGAAGGQALELQLQGQSVASSDQVRLVYERKTSSLLMLAMRLAALFGRATPHQNALLCRYAQSLGMAFQVLDDLIDILGTAAQAGKDVQADGKKKTLTALLGVPGALDYANSLLMRASSCAEGLGQGSWLLAELVDFVRAQSPLDPNYHSIQYVETLPGSHPSAAASVPAVRAS